MQPHALPLKLRLPYDGFLVACYSDHPLVGLLKKDKRILESRIPVTGIFDASVATCLQLIDRGEKFGIVSTGKTWEQSLTRAVIDFLGLRSPTPFDTGHRFAGVETTGLAATELHFTGPGEVRHRMKEATKRLLRKDDSVKAICLGCAGMAGMEDMVREACVEELGEVLGQRIKIVDGVVAGVAWLEGAMRTQF
jgi:Asp/Glu/hydantoin racemase